MDSSMPSKPNPVDGSHAEKGHADKGQVARSNAQAAIPRAKCVFDDGAGVGSHHHGPQLSERRALPADEHIHDDCADGLPNAQENPHAAGVVDRRMGHDRRALLEQLGELDEGNTGLERRRGPGRRLSDRLRSAEEGELTKEQFLFVMAMEAFKKANGKTFPTWTDVLDVMRLLGYRKTVPMEISLPSAEDWQEPYTAASGVRSPRWARHCKVDAQRKAG